VQEAIACHLLDIGWCDFMLEAGHCSTSF
jgi:hypothetical protein